MKLCLCFHRPHQVPGAGASRIRRFTPVSLIPRVCILSMFLSHHLRILDWILVWVGPLQFPEGRMTASFFIGMLQIDRISQILRRFFLTLNGLCNTRFVGFDFANAGFNGIRFAIGEPSLEVASCPFFDIALCFLIGSERKLLKWLQENIEKFTMLNKRRR